MVGKRHLKFTQKIFHRKQKREEVPGIKKNGVNGKVRLQVRPKLQLHLQYMFFLTIPITGLCGPEGSGRLTP